MSELQKVVIRAIRYIMSSSGHIWSIMDTICIGLAQKL